MEQSEIEKKIYEIRILESQAKQLEEQIIMVEQQVAQLSMIQENLNDIGKISNQKILSQLAKDVFIETRAENAKTVLVNVGAGIIVRKTIDETKNYIENQKGKFLEARGKISGEIVKIINKMSEIEGEIRH